MENETIKIEKQAQDKGRAILLLMLVFFIVPIVVVVTMFKLNWKPEGESIGELIRPPIQLITSNGLLHSDGADASATLLKEKWSVVYIAESCDDTCYNKLRDLRQLHVSLYKDIMRAQRILITKSTMDEAILAKVKRDFPDMVIVNQPIASVDNMISQFKTDAFDPALANRYYFVDPLGFLMMRYQPDVPLASVRKDLKRLLKFSWAG